MQNALEQVRRSVRAFARKHRAHKTLAAIDREDPPQEIIKIALDELSVGGVAAALETSGRRDWEHRERQVDLPHDLNAQQCQKLTDAIHSLSNRDAAVMWAYRVRKDVASLDVDQRTVLLNVIIQSNWDEILRDVLEWLPRVSDVERALVERVLAELPADNDDRSFKPS